MTIHVRKIQIQPSGALTSGHIYILLHGFLDSHLRAIMTTSILMLDVLFEYARHCSVMALHPYPERGRFSLELSYIFSQHFYRRQLV